MLVLAVALVLIATYAGARVVGVLWRRIRGVADDHRRVFRVEAVISLGDELLVSLTSEPAGSSRWLYSQVSVSAVVMLARWRDARMSIQIIDDDNTTVLRPIAMQVGLRFRAQSNLVVVEVLHSLQ